MTWQFFRSHRDSRVARPILETLETREVPTGVGTVVGATLQDVAVQIHSLQVSVAGGNYVGANLIFQSVSNDFAVLQNNGPQLDTGTRLQVDNALISNGLALVQIGTNTFLQNPTFGVNLAVVGVDAVITGSLDSMITGLYGSQNTTIF
jgi:hypothetical protein